jgi:hypothetical protein
VWELLRGVQNFAPEEHSGKPVRGSGKDSADFPSETQTSACWKSPMVISNLVRLKGKPDWSRIRQKLETSESNDPWTVMQHLALIL